MKILNISQNDYSNFAHDNAKALRSVGVDCVDIKTHKHQFNYPSESRLVEKAMLIREAKKADIIQIFHSDHVLLELVKGLGKRLIVHHTGSRHRADPERSNAIFNPHVEKSIIALCEFAGLGSKNEHYMVGAVKVDDYNPKLLKQPYTLGHYPSHSIVKGTAKIMSMLELTRTEFILKHSTELVDFEKQAQRMRECDIYIELYNPEIDGRPYGSWGITALEAAAMGKIVVTQNLNNEVYHSNYGKCPFVLAESEQDFINKLEVVLSRSQSQIKEWQKDTYEWVKRNHSFEATGQRMKNILGL